MAKKTKPAAAPAKPRSTRGRGRPPKAASPPPAETHTSSRRRGSPSPAPSDSAEEEPASEVGREQRPKSKGKEKKFAPILDSGSEDDENEAEYVDAREDNAESAPRNTKRADRPLDVVDPDFRPSPSREESTSPTEEASVQIPLVTPSTPPPASPRRTSSGYPYRPGRAEPSPPPSMAPPPPPPPAPATHPTIRQHLLPRLQEDAETLAKHLRVPKFEDALWKSLWDVYLRSFKVVLRNFTAYDDQLFLLIDSVKEYDREFQADAAMAYSLSNIAVLLDVMTAHMESRQDAHVLPTLIYLDKYFPWDFISRSSVSPRWEHLYEFMESVVHIRLQTWLRTIPDNSPRGTLFDSLANHFLYSSAAESIFWETKTITPELVHSFFGKGPYRPLGDIHASPFHAHASSSDTSPSLQVEASAILQKHLRPLLDTILDNDDAIATLRDVYPVSSTWMPLRGWLVATFDELKRSGHRDRVFVPDSNDSYPHTSAYNNLPTSVHQQIAREAGSSSSQAYAQTHQYGSSPYSQQQQQQQQHHHPHHHHPQGLPLSYSPSLEPPGTLYQGVHDLARFKSIQNEESSNPLSPSPYGVPPTADMHGTRKRGRGNSFDDSPYTPEGITQVRWHESQYHTDPRSSAAPAPYPPGPVNGQHPHPHHQPPPTASQSDAEVTVIQAQRKVPVKRRRRTISGTPNASSQTTDFAHSSSQQKQQQQGTTEFAPSASSTGGGHLAASLSAGSLPPPPAQPGRKELVTRRFWTQNDSELLIKFIAQYGCNWALIEKQGENLFEIRRTQQQVRDRARNMKVDMLRSDKILPLGFDCVSLHRKEQDLLIRYGRNPNRREIDVDAHGHILRHLYDERSDPERGQR